MEIRGTYGRPPFKHELDPTAFPDLLPYTLLYEIHPSLERLKLRLAGDEIRRWLRDRPLAGRWLDDVLPAPVAHDWFLKAMTAHRSREQVAVRDRMDRGDRISLLRELAVYPVSEADRDGTIFGISFARFDTVFFRATATGCNQRENRREIPGLFLD